jgi:hypothetical protein
MQMISFSQTRKAVPLAALVCVVVAGEARAETFSATTTYPDIYNGNLQTYTIPTTGVYQISAYGGQGGASSDQVLTYSNGTPSFTASPVIFGGLGGIAGANFSLNAGDVLTILVGIGGGNGSTSSLSPFGISGGGSGGTLISINGTTLLVAGGGGGAGGSIQNIFPEQPISNALQANGGGGGGGWYGGGGGGGGTYAFSGSWGPYTGGAGGTNGGAGGNGVEPSTAGANYGGSGILFCNEFIGGTCPGGGGYNGSGANGGYGGGGAGTANGGSGGGGGSLGTGSGFEFVSGGNGNGSYGNGSGGGSGFISSLALAGSSFNQFATWSGNGLVEINLVPVPEPSTTAGMLALGGLGITFMRRRVRQSS